eukprot:g3945.t1
MRCSLLLFVVAVLGAGVGGRTSSASSRSGATADAADGGPDDPKQAKTAEEVAERSQRSVLAQKIIALEGTVQDMILSSMKKRKFSRAKAKADLSRLQSTMAEDSQQLRKVARPMVPGASLLGSGYNIITGRHTAPVVHFTEMRETAGGATDAEVLNKYSVPMAVVAQVPAALMTKTATSSVFSSTQDVLDSKMRRHGVGDTDAGFIMDERITSSVRGDIARAYALVESIEDYDLLNLKLKPESWQAKANFEMLKNRMQMGERTSVDLVLRTFDEENDHAARRKFSWEGLDFRIRPWSILTPDFVRAADAIPPCCLSSKHALEDDDFPSVLSGFFDVLDPDSLVYHGMPG